MKLGTSFVCGSLAALSVFAACAAGEQGTMNIGGTDFAVWTGYSLVPGAAGSELPDGALGFWGNNSAAYQADNPAPEPAGGIAFVRAEKSVFGGVLRNVIYVRCRTQESCIPAGLQDRAERMSRKGFRITVTDFAAWQETADMLNSAPGIKEWSPDIDYNAGAEAQ